MPKRFAPLYTIDDKTLCEHFHLNSRSLSEAKALYTSKHYEQSVEAIAQAILDRPFVNPTDEAELSEIALIIKKDIPKQFRHLKNLADNYWSVAKPRLQGKNPDEEELWYTGATETPRKRGGVGFGLLRLFHLTGDKKYLKNGIAEFTRLIETLPPYTDTAPLPDLSWQPWGHKLPGSGHNPGHIMQELCLALPFMRKHITAREFVPILRGMVLCQDVFYRSNMTDIMFNIPLHFLTGAHMIYVSLPELNISRSRKQIIRRHIATSYRHAPHTTKDGYFNEGTMYQAVVQYLLLINGMFTTADKGVVPASQRRITENAYDFMHKILRNDGFHSLIGDTRQISPHEYEISPNQVFPLAAAVFKRKDFMSGAGNAYDLDLNEHHIWLMGVSGYKRIKKYGMTPAEKRIQRAYTFKDTQYNILGCGKGLEAHQGLLHAQPHLNHAHFDMGHIDICSHGRILLSDPGISSYAFPDVSKSIDAQSHNTLRLGRYSPAGPRLHLTHYSKTSQFVVTPAMQVSSVVLKHYEGLVHTRSLVLCDAHRPQESFWLVLDSVKHTGEQKHHIGKELGEVAFHFNAPESELGLDESTLTCWSRHSGKNKILTRYPEGDFAGQKKGTLFKWKDRVKAALEIDNNANLQITGLLPIDLTNHMDIRAEDSFTHQYGQIVKRPAVKYNFDCELPFVSAFVLVPYKGILKSAYAKVTGDLTLHGGTVEVDMPKRKRIIEITKASSHRPFFTLR